MKGEKEINPFPRRGSPLTVWQFWPVYEGKNYMTATDEAK